MPLLHEMLKIGTGIMALYLNMNIRKKLHLKPILFQIQYKAIVTPKMVNNFQNCLSNSSNTRQRTLPGLIPVKSDVECLN